jgi:hypothetical protein
MYLKQALYPAQVSNSLPLPPRHLSSSTPLPAWLGSLCCRPAWLNACSPVEERSNWVSWLAIIQDECFGPPGFHHLDDVSVGERGTSLLREHGECAQQNEEQTQFRSHRALRFRASFPVPTPKSRRSASPAREPLLPPEKSI